MNWQFYIELLGPNREPVGLDAKPAQFKGYRGKIVNAAGIRFDASKQLCTVVAGLQVVDYTGHIWFRAKLDKTHTLFRNDSMYLPAGDVHIHLLDTSSWAISESTWLTELEAPVAKSVIRRLLGR